MKGPALSVNCLVELELDYFARRNTDFGSENEVLIWIIPLTRVCENITVSIESIVQIAKWHYPIYWSVLFLLRKIKESTHSRNSTIGVQIQDVNSLNEEGSGNSASWGDFVWVGTPFSSTINMGL